MADTNLLRLLQEFILYLKARHTGQTLYAVCVCAQGCIRTILLLWLPLHRLQEVVTRRIPCTSEEMSSRLHPATECGIEGSNTTPPDVQQLLTRCILFASIQERHTQLIDFLATTVGVARLHHINPIATSCLWPRNPCASEVIHSRRVIVVDVLLCRMLASLWAGRQSPQSTDWGYGSTAIAGRHMSTSAATTVR